MKKDFENDFSEPKTENDALSEEELALLKASIESAKVDRSKLPPHDNSKKANIIRTVKKHKLLVICALLLSVALLGAVIFGCVFAVSSLIKATKKYVYVIGEAETYELSKKDAIINDILYVDMRKIALHTGMMISGTESKIQFTSKNGSYIIFENEYGYAIISGRRTEIKADTMDGRKKTSVPAYVTKDECLVPFSFLQKTVASDTMRLEFDPEAKTVGIYPKYIVYNGDVENRVMVSTRFMALEWSEPPVYTYEYSIDVSPYLDNITSKYLSLVNKSNSTYKAYGDIEYEPDDLRKVEAPADNENQQLREDAERALYAMSLEMKQAGVEDFYVTSSYRSYKRQVDLYWNTYVDKYIGLGYSFEEAQKKASEYSARPGESEHQTGLCLDFTTDSIYGKLNESFENTDAFKWLSENAHKYGFILRYPKEAEKVAITGYDYEPWHYRFVGRQAATEMYYSGECLEEYLK